MHFRDSPDSLNGLEIPGNIWFRRFAVTYIDFLNNAKCIYLLSTWFISFINVFFNIYLKDNFNIQSFQLCLDKWVLFQFSILDSGTFEPSPPPQFWSHFHERCVMRWNGWKNNLPIFVIFIFRVIVKIHRKLTILRTKNTITRKTKFWNLIFLFIQAIPDLSCKFDHFWCCITYACKTLKPGLGELCWWR